ncbi:MAG: peptidoglycan editing factor PgeF [Gammaproteobacteria bacterium]|nr:MAG: peptidoglycan editing factor PgeF [Gammaproteobacteria bacterium]
MSPSPELIQPDWPVPETVRACCTTRVGGFSRERYAGFNLAGHVGDEPQNVQANRERLAGLLGLPGEPLWLSQVHGNRAIHSQQWQPGIEADACITDQPDTVCVVMTADCLPILLYHAQAGKVAAIHAGWRGLLAGIIPETLSLAGDVSSEWLVWLGPAISQAHFEVGEEVYVQFCDTNSSYEQAFHPSARRSHWLLDMTTIARLQFQEAGVTAIHGSGWCTFADTEHFYSHRRDGAAGPTGRMASLIWRTE